MIALLGGLQHELAAVPALQLGGCRHRVPHHCSIDVGDDRKTLHVVAYSTNPTAVLYTQNTSPSGAGLV